MPAALAAERVSGVFTLRSEFLFINVLTGRTQLLRSHQKHSFGINIKLNDSFWIFFLSFWRGWRIKRKPLWICQKISMPHCLCRVISHLWNKLFHVKVICRDILIKCLAASPRFKKKKTFVLVPLWQMYQITCLHLCVLESCMFIFIYRYSVGSYTCMIKIIGFTGILWYLNTYTNSTIWWMISSGSPQVGTMLNN